ncbi:hypothetical protein IFM89_028902 [Coptis chinensis]|uniref:Carboxypeptidase n=1 Tax=Coptis chinensis TaxID=261450 RepID=A0A835H660_9MAGN|nr:hypothetical protein IFM89_028902 [Coptis chinensis]
MERNLIVVILLFLVSIALSSAANSSSKHGLRNSPYGVADKLIKQLNLLPQDAQVVNISSTKSIIVEKSFRFPGLIGSGASVEELGHRAGYYRIKHSHAARMFYFFFESRNNKKDPVVIWLTGGPGCSSELAVFYENGPFTIADNMSLVWNDYGWDKASNLIYVDQPIGTGFSYSSDKRDFRHNEEGVSNDLYDFLQAFFAEHPQFAENDFYITGESYAGHYIPAFASRVNQGNKVKEGIHINLKGFAIGNGLTDPAVQYKAYTDYALQMKIIQESEYKSINGMVPECERTIELCAKNGGDDCIISYDACTSIFNKILNIAGNVNVRNSRWVHAMEWYGQKEFAGKPTVPFMVDGAEAGVLKSSGPLSFLKVFFPFCV